MYNTYFREYVEDRWLSNCINVLAKKNLEYIENCGYNWKTCQNPFMEKDFYKYFCKERVQIPKAESFHNFYTFY